MADLDIELYAEMTGGPVVSIKVTTPAGLLYIMADVTIVGRQLRLDGLHMHGLDANAIGMAHLRLIAQLIMQEFSYDGITVQGGVRTSGANPGRIPGLLRFTCKA